MFVCVDEYDNKYLVMTYNPYMLEYVFIRVRDTDLVNMLENRITMEQVYRNADIIYLSRDSENEELEVETYTPKSFSADMLPVAGRYYELQIDYVDRYVDELKTNIAAGIERIEYQQYDEWKVQSGRGTSSVVYKNSKRLNTKIKFAVSASSQTMNIRYQKADTQEKRNTLIVRHYYVA